MARILFWALLGLAVLWLARRALRNRSDVDVPGATQALVRCAHCGVLVPHAEAVGRGTHIYCSLDHADRGPGDS